MEGVLENYRLLVSHSLADFSKSKNAKIYEVMAFNVLQRHHYSIQTLLELLPKLKKDRGFRFPFYVQLRVGLLDSITFLYMLHFAEKDDSYRFEIEMARLNVQTAKALWHEYNQMKKHDRVSAQTGLLNWLPNNFKTVSGQFQLNADIKDIYPKEMCEFLKKTERFKSFGEAHIVYDVLSKYEHFNELSKPMLNLSNEDEFPRLHISLIVVFQSSLIALQVMKFPQVRLNTLKRLIDKLYEKETI